MLFGFKEDVILNLKILQHINLSDIDSATYKPFWYQFWTLRWSKWIPNVINCCTSSRKNVSLKWVSVVLNRLQKGNNIYTEINFFKKSCFGHQVIFCTNLVNWFIQASYVVISSNASVQLSEVHDCIQTITYVH